MAEKRVLPLRPGDTVTLRKKHPCGCDRFRVVRAGTDVRVICLGCGRDMMLPRDKFERAVRKHEHQPEEV